MSKPERLCAFCLGVPGEGAACKHCEAALSREQSGEPSPEIAKDAKRNAAKIMKVLAR